MKTLRPVAWAAILGMVLAVCGTALGIAALATHAATMDQVQKAGGSLVVSIVVLVVAVNYFEDE